LIVISHLYTVSRLLNRIKVFGIYNKFRRGREDEGGGGIFHNVSHVLVKKSHRESFSSEDKKETKTLTREETSLLEE
jgi:hypothetical protein